MSGEIYFEIGKLKPNDNATSWIYSDVIYGLESLKIEIGTNARLSKRLKRRILDALAAASQEIVDLRAARKPRLVKRRRS